MGCPMIAVTYTLAFQTSATAKPGLVIDASGCGSVGITVNGRTQPALADPGGLVLKAAQAALPAQRGSPAA